MAVYAPEVMLPDYIDLPRKGGSGFIDIEECVKKRVLAWMPEEWRRVDAAVLKEKVKELPSLQRPKNRNFLILLMPLTIPLVDLAA